MSSAKKPEHATRIFIACIACLALAFALEIFFFNFQFWNTRNACPIEINALSTQNLAQNTNNDANSGVPPTQSQAQNIDNGANNGVPPTQIQTQNQTNVNTSSDQTIETKQGILTQHDDVFSTSMYIETSEELKQQEAIHNPERTQLISKDEALDTGTYFREQNASSVIEDDNISQEEVPVNKRYFTFSVGGAAQDGAVASEQEQSGGETSNTAASEQEQSASTQSAATSQSNSEQETTSSNQANLQTLWLSYSTEEPITLEIEVRDEGHALYQTQDKITLERTSGTTSTTHEQLICLHPVGKASSVRISVDTMRSYSLSMAFNRQAALDINAPRLSSLAFVFLLIFALRPKSNLRFINSRRTHYFVLGAAACIFAFVFAYMKSSDLAVDATAESQYADLAKALAGGQFFLNESPPEALAQISNPYDNALRDALGISARWDCAYFDGHYFVYFGILPVLLMHLPFYLLTGAALPNWFAVACFSSAFIIGLLFLISCIAKMLNKHISLAALILAFCSCLAISFIANALRFPAIYVVCISCAMALVVWGISFWIKALTPKTATQKDIAQQDAAQKNATQENAAQKAMVQETLMQKNTSGFYIHPAWGFAGSAFMAATILARPTFLIYSLFGVALIVGAFMLHKQRGVKLANNIGAAEANSLHTVAALVISIIPYLLFFGIAAYYNNARFASPLDFGAAYNLTSNDLVHRGFDIQRALSGIFVYLFQLPNYQLNYPFLGNTNASQGYIGVLSVERSVGGLFVLFPVLLSLLFVFSKNVRQRFANRANWSVVFVIIVGVMIAFVLAFFDANAAGIMERYYMDFGLALAISFLVFFIAVLPKGLQKPSACAQLQQEQVLSQQEQAQQKLELKQLASVLEYFIWITFAITVLNALIWIGTTSSVFA